MHFKSSLPNLHNFTLLATLHYFALFYCKKFAVKETTFYSLSYIFFRVVLGPGDNFDDYSDYFWPETICADVWLIRKPVWFFIHFFMHCVVRWRLHLRAKKQIFSDQQLFWIMVLVSTTMLSSSSTYSLNTPLILHLFAPDITHLILRVFGGYY